MEKPDVDIRRVGFTEQGGRVITKLEVSAKKGHSAKIRLNVSQGHVRDTASIERQHDLAKP